MSDYRKIVFQGESGETKKKTIDCSSLEDAQGDLQDILDAHNLSSIVDATGNYIGIDNANEVVQGAVYSFGNKKKQRRGYPEFKVEDYNFKDYLNKNINNIYDVDLYERETAQANIMSFLNFDWSASPKPCCMSLWSGRGSGKTSLIRHIALFLEAFESQRNCGRLLVFDVDNLLDIPTVLAHEEATSIGHVVPCLVALHLCQIFGDSTVNNVQFNDRATFPLLWDCYHNRNPTQWNAEFDHTLVQFLRRLHDAKQAYMWWRECTQQLCEKVGHEVNPDPIVILDTAELLAIANEKTPSPVKIAQTPPTPVQNNGRSTPVPGSPAAISSHTSRNHTKSGERYLVLEWMMLGIPKLHYLLAFGTGARREYLRPRDDHTRVNHKVCDPLTALGLESAEKLYTVVMSENGNVPVELDGQAKRNIRLAYAITAGVPRMLKAAFQARKGKAGTWNEIWEQVAQNLYADASELVGESRLQVSALAKAILISHVCDLDVNLYKNKQIPSESTTWDDLRWDSVAYLGGKDGKMCYRIPCLLWGCDEKVHSSLCGWTKANCNFLLEDLVPTVRYLYSEAGDASSVASGRAWEKMFASFLVARFYALCWLQDKNPEDSYIALNEILPQMNEEDDSMLSQVEVNLCNGINESNSEVFAELAPVKECDYHSIHANWLVKSAHHDMILPVRCGSTKARMLWAVSARNGNHKTEGELLKTRQHLVRKGSSDEVAGILQAVNPRLDPQGTRFNGKFLELTGQKRYAQASIYKGHAPFALYCSS